MLLIFLIELIKDILAMAGRRRHARNKAVITAVRSQWHWFLTCKIYNISHCTLWTHFGSCINVKKKKLKKKGGKGVGEGGQSPKWWEYPAQPFWPRCLLHSPARPSHKSPGPDPPAETSRQAFRTTPPLAMSHCSFTFLFGRSTLEARSNNTDFEDGDMMHAHCMK